jgi:hypothetical protein
MNLIKGVSVDSADQPSQRNSCYALSYKGGEYAFDGTTTPCTGTFIIDLSLFDNNQNNQNYYIGMYNVDYQNPGTIESFKIIDNQRNQYYSTNTPLNCDYQQYSFASCTTNKIDDNAIDQIINIEHANNIYPNSEVSVKIDYTVTTNRDILVDLLNVDNNWSWHGGNHITVEPGTNSCSLSFSVTNNPQPGENYIILVKILPEGGYWSEAITENSSKINLIQLKDNANLIQIAGPSYIQNNTTVYYYIQYTINQNYDLLIDLINADNDYSWHGGTRVTITPETTGISLNFKVTNEPVTGSNYIITAKIIPVNGQYDEAITEKTMNVTLF